MATPKMKFFSNADWKNAVNKTPSTQSPQQSVQAPSGTAQTSPVTGNQVSTGYNPSYAVTNAQNAYNQHTANKPGAYQSQYQEQMDNMMSQIQNRGPFQYDVNADAMYQQLVDQYVNQGRQAMMDTMGQASALTGGYGSSYAQNVGQQTYQGYLQQANEMVPQLYQMALQKYQMEGEDLYNQYGMLSDRENQEYGRYRDQVSDYNTELDRLYNQYVTERGFDYDQYVSDRDYQYQVGRDQVADKQWQDSFDYQKSRDEVADSQWQTEFEYQQGRDQVADGQWNQSFEYQQGRDEVADQQWADEFAYQQSQDQIANDQWNQSFEYQQGRDQVSDQQWQESMDYQQGRDQVKDQQWQSEFDEDKRRYDQEYAATQKASGSSGGSSKTSSNSTDKNSTSDSNSKNSTSGEPKNYSDVNKQVQQMANAGATKSEISAYVRSAQSSGAITQNQAQALLKKYNG